MAKTIYKKLEIKTIVFEQADIVTASGDGENFGTANTNWIPAGGDE